MVSTSLQMLDHTGHDMMLPDTNTGDDAQSICECCQQQCNCPPSMITNAVLLDSQAIEPSNLVTLALPDVTTRVVKTALATPQRPPKPFIS